MLPDLKFTLRQLFKSPGYTALAVGALALGIGANTVLFSAINTLFLRPLGYTEPQQLVHVWSAFPKSHLEQTNASWPRYQMWRDQQDVFSEMTAQAFTQFTLTGKGDPESLPGSRVSANFFPALGVAPLLGRNFTAEEDHAGGANVVLLSYGFWQRRFGGSRDIVGQPITLNGTAFTVIGVLPSALGFPFAQTQVWASRVFEVEGLPRELVERGTGYLTLLARLKPTATRAQAEEEMKVIHARYAAANPGKVDAKAGLHVVSFHEDLVGGQRPMLLTLLAAVGCVLLIACANVANLLLARFTARRKEIAIRTALGATRARLIAQFLAESLLTAAAAGVVGVLLAVWGLDVLARVGANFIPRIGEVSLDLRVLGFAVVLSLLTGLVLGLVPAIQASRIDPNESLKDATRGSTGRHAGAFRASLLVAEVTMSVFLLVCATLFITSFKKLQQVDAGFHSTNVTTFFLGLPGGSYPDIAPQSQFFRTALDKLRALPGVTAVSAGSAIPVVSGGNTRSPASVEGRPLPPVSDRPIMVRSTILPGFLAALDIPIKQGRDFTWRDTPDTPYVVIINETFAKQFFSGENPVGHRLITGIGSIPREIVGVAGDVRSQNLSQPAVTEMYYPATQLDGQFLSVLVRSSRPAASLRPEITAAIHSLDAGLPVGDVQAYDELLAQAVADRRLSMLMLGGFAALALALAGMGIYSVIAYGVAQRTNEFGIRMALGANPANVVGLVMREGLSLVGIGLAAGLALSLLAALALSRYVANLLFEVSVFDPLVLGSVAVFVCAVAALACFIPARRATKIDPMTALRAE